MALWNIRTMAETEIDKRVSGRFAIATVQFANKRSRFPNLFGSFAIVLLASNQVVRVCDFCFKAADQLGRIRFHLV